MFDFKNAKEDGRETRGGWCKGGYTCKCIQCNSSYFGDKRSWECADCAYGAHAWIGHTKSLKMRGLSKWDGWDRSNLPWSEAKHKDAVCYAAFGDSWSMEDANALIGFIERTWGSCEPIMEHPNP